MKRGDEASMFDFDIWYLEAHENKEGVKSPDFFLQYLGSQYMMWINVFSVFSSILSIHSESMGKRVCGDIYLSSCLLLV